MWLEVISLSPARIPYCGRNRRKILLNIATLNVRTLIDSDENDRPHRRTALVAHALKRYNIDIAALSKTRLSEEDTLTEVREGCTFFWKGYPANERRNHGVSFTVKTKLPSKIPDSERLMSWRIPLAKGRYATLLSAYAPTLDSKVETKDSFYELLDSAINQTPREDKLILLGDFNARVGREHHIWGGAFGHRGVGQYE
ncbi:craniofacial development protein 2-like [Palaemon carinicauda]|uniref:craniofacial development protein 2-like n=1 Tax=Palaemon carinicauda TaxID=392227 RepID=UPI0035B645D9